MGKFFSIFFSIPLFIRVCEWLLYLVMFGSTGSGAGVKGRLTLCPSFKIHFVKLRSVPAGVVFCSSGTGNAERMTGARERERWNWSGTPQKKRQKV